MSAWEEDGDRVCDRCGNSWFGHLSPGNGCPGPLTDEELDEQDGDALEDVSR